MRFFQNCETKEEVKKLYRELAKQYHPDCGETNCIYQQINNAVKGDGTDEQIETAIYEVCKERNITDQKTIDLIKANYYL